MNQFIPEVTAWYQEVSSGNLFEVVAYDEESGNVEYQLVDGEVGEFDRSSWSQLLLMTAEAPEDWRCSYELSREDRVTSDYPIVPENYSGALSQLEPELWDPGDDFLDT